MSPPKFNRSRESAETIDARSVKDTLQWLERDTQERRGDPHWHVPAQIMNLMHKLCKEGGGNPVVVFTWLRDVERVTQHPTTGRLLFYCRTTFAAENLFQFCGEPILKAFRTRNITTVVGQRLMRHLGNASDKQAMAPELARSLASALAALGPVDHPGQAVTHA